MERFSDKVTSVVIGVVVLAVLALGAIPLYETIAVDGQVKYCFVTSTVWHAPDQANIVVYSLWGFRPWRSDRLIVQNVNSLDKVKAAADSMGCAVK